MYHMMYSMTYFNENKMSYDFLDKYKENYLFTVKINNGIWRNSKQKYNCIKLQLKI